MLSRHPQALVKFGPHAADLARFAGHPVLPPHLRHGAGNGDEVGGRGQQHAVAEGEVPQLRIGFQRGRHEVFAGNEHHHVIGRFLELGLVGLGPQGLHMVAHRLGVERQVARPLLLAVGLESGLVGVQGHLGVDHQLLLARHVDNGIGPQPPAFGFHRVFKVKIGVLRQAALFQHVLQGPLAPAAARLGGIGQRIAQPLRLALHLFLALAHLFDHAGQLAEGIHAPRLKALHLLLIALQPVTNGGQQGLQLLLAGLFRMAQPLVRCRQKRLLRLGQHGMAGVLEFLEQFLPGGDEQALLLLEMGGIGLQRGQLSPQPLPLAPGGIEFARQRIGPGGPLAHGGKVHHQRLDLLLLLRRARLHLGERTGAEKPAQRSADQQGGNCKHDGDKRIHETSAELERKGNLLHSPAPRKRRAAAANRKAQGSPHKSSLENSARKIVWGAYKFRFAKFSRL